VVDLVILAAKRIFALRSLTRESASARTAVTESVSLRAARRRGLQSSRHRLKHRRLDFGEMRRRYGLVDLVEGLLRKTSTKPFGKIVR